MTLVIVSGLIHQQIDRIWLATAERKGETAAKEAVGRIWEVLALLGKQPRIGVEGRCRGKEIRRFLAGDYWIYYVLETSRVRIRQVKHHKRRQATYWDVPGGL